MYSVDSVRSRSDDRVTWSGRYRSRFWH